MEKSSLTIDKYFFPVININANPNFTPAHEHNFCVDISSEVSTEPIGDKKVYQLALALKIEENEDKQAAYTGEVHIVGFFKVSPKLSVDEFSVIMHTRGAKLLYSAAREFILTITGRGPWPAITLPEFAGPNDDDVENIKKRALGLKDKKTQEN